MSTVIKSQETPEAIPQEAGEKIEKELQTHPYKVFSDIFSDQITEKHNQINAKTKEKTWGLLDVDVIFDSITTGDTAQALKEAKRLSEQYSLQNITPEQIVDEITKVKLELDDLHKEFAKTAQQLTVQEVFEAAQQYVEKPAEITDYNTLEHQYQVATKYLDAQSAEATQQRTFEAAIYQLQTVFDADVANKILNTKYYPDCLREDSVVRLALAVYVGNKIDSINETDTGKIVAYKIKQAIEFVYDWRELWPNEQDAPLDQINLEGVNPVKIRLMRQALTEHLLSNESFTHNKEDVQGVLHRAGLA